MKVIYILQAHPLLPDREELEAAERVITSAFCDRCTRK